MTRRGHSLRTAALSLGAIFVAGTFLALGASNAAAQGPSAVPWRAYGTATVSGAPAPAGTTINAVSSASSSTTCGTGTVSGASGNYFVDVQQIPGCLGSVNFTVNGQPTSGGAVTPPDIAGSPKQVNLTTSQATATPPPPPPPPAATTAPPPPPPPPPPAATAPVATPTVVVPVAPPNTGVGPGPSRQAPVQAPAVQAPAVSAVPQLPNTGTGGLLSKDSATPIPWLFAAIALAAVALLGSATALRRSR